MGLARWSAVFQTVAGAVRVEYAHQLLAGVLVVVCFRTHRGKLLFMFGDVCVCVCMCVLASCESVTEADLESSQKGACCASRTPP